MAQAQTLHGAGLEVLDQHIRAFGEARDDGPPLLALQVHGNHPLVAKNARGVQRLPVHTLAQAANRVAFGHLHLDHVRAEVGQQPPAKRPSHAGPEFQHANARKGSVFLLCHAISLRLASPLASNMQALQHRAWPQCAIS
ncbi:hypothetical protein D3C78_1467690 [compost metagenome]